VKLAQAIDWRFLEEKFGAVYTDKPGHPPLPTRLMAGLAILKHSYDVSDEVLCERWVENPYFQYFCGEEFFQHRLVFDRSSLMRWRQRMGEEKLQALLQESLAVAARTEAMKPSDLARIVVDTTVQPKAVMFPTDAKLLNRARERLCGWPRRSAWSLSARRQARAHQAPALCPCAPVQAHQQEPTQAEDLSRNPYDGHTLAKIIPDMQALVGNVLDRIITYAGYRGHNAPPEHRFRVYTAGQKRRVTAQIKRELKRRAAVEPVIGHLSVERRKTADWAQRNSREHGNSGSR
jgi:Transposase domain (DUF772)